MKRLIWLSEAIIFFVLSASLSLIPYSLIKGTGRLLGLLTYYLWRSRRLIAIENLKNIIERSPSFSGLEPEDVIKENFKNMGHSLIEVLKLYSGMADKILSSVSIEGKENFEKARSKGKGVLFITGHCGNWELMAIAMSSEIEKVSVVARPLNNPYLNRIIESIRGKYGNSVIYKKGALRNIIRTLRDKGSVGILMDQAVVPEEGVIIDFLGRPAWTTKVPSIIARASSSALLPVFIRRTKNGHTIKISPEIALSDDEIEDTKLLSRFIEDYIRENPSEWLWIHRRWKRAW